MSPLNHPPKNHPHDRFFRELFDDIAFAKAFLQAYMSAKVCACINWDTLQVFPTALFGERSKSLFADASYKVETHDQATLFIILNHETKPDSTLSIRKLEYKLGALKRAHKAKEKPALIYFITWQSGKKIPAHFPKNIADYFENPQLAKALFLEDDVIVAQDLSDEMLLKSGEASILTVFMKYAQGEDFLAWIKNNKTVAEEFAENRYIDRAIEYLLEVGHYDEDALEQAFKSASEKLKEKMLTTRQRIENRGLRRGRQQGMQNKALDIARYMLRALHLGVDKVQEATGLSRQVVHQIAQEEA